MSDKRRRLRLGFVRAHVDGGHLAGVPELVAGWITADVFGLIDEVRDAVAQQTGLALETEVKTWRSRSDA